MPDLDVQFSHTGYVPVFESTGIVAISPTSFLAWCVWGDPEFVICMKNSWKKPFVFPVKTLNFPHFYFRHMYQIPGMNTFCLGYVTITVTGIM
jgi:hypothetical protein